MVLGHFGFALGAKKAAPKVSLGTLFMAAQWADLLWPTLLLLGVEHVGLQPDNKKFPLDFTDYPVTHSLLMGMVWGLAFGLVYWLVRKDIRSAVVAGICVVSHWVLDVFVHHPDLPIVPGSSFKMGFGLWNYPLVVAVIEFSMFAVGLALYMRATKAKNATGKWSLWLMVVLLVAGHIAGLMSPAPESVHALGWMAQIQWVYVALGYWVDSRRVSKVDYVEGADRLRVVIG